MTLTNKNMVPVSEVQYLLTKLMSECNELSHAVSKVLDFGIDDEAHLEHVGYSGKRKIEEEFNDVLGIIDMLGDIGFNVSANPMMIKAKRNKVQHYMADSRRRGVLTYEQSVTPTRLRETRISFNHFLMTNPVKIIPESKMSSSPPYTVKHTRARLTYHLVKFPTMFQDLMYVVTAYRLGFPDATFGLHGEVDPETGHYEVHLTLVYESRDITYLDKLLEFESENTSKTTHRYPELQVFYVNKDPHLEDEEIKLMFPENNNEK
jgi:hypothetical protein